MAGGAERAYPRLREKTKANAEVYAGLTPAPDSRQVLRRRAFKACKRRASGEKAASIAMRRRRKP